jgi:histone-binding protein RBBP4
VGEAYKIWKKHSPFLYNILQTYPLASCSQTVDWFAQNYLENDWRIYSLVLGTNSLAQNAVMVLNVGLPTDDALTDYASYREEAPEGEVGTNGFIGTMGTQAVTPKIVIPQASEVMRARINRHDENLLAVKTGGVSPELLLYDLRNKEADLESKVVKLAGHENEGFGLSWNPLLNGRLLSGSDDQKIFLYDVVHPDVESVSWTASGGVEDIKWSNFDDSIFATAQQDEKMGM